MTAARARAQATRTLDVELVTSRAARETVNAKAVKACEVARARADSGIGRPLPTCHGGGDVFTQLVVHAWLFKQSAPTASRQAAWRRPLRRQRLRSFEVVGNVGATGGKVGMRPVRELGSQARLPPLRLRHLQREHGRAAAAAVRGGARAAGQLPVPVPPKAAQLPVPLPPHPKAQPPQGRLRAGSTTRSVAARLVDRGRLEDAARRRWRAEAEDAKQEFPEARRLLDSALAPQNSEDSREAGARSRSPCSRGAQRARSYESCRVPLASVSAGEEMSTRRRP